MFSSTVTPLEASVGGYKRCDLTRCCGCFRERKVWYGLLTTLGAVGNGVALYDYSQGDDISASVLVVVSTMLWVAACGVRILATDYTAEQNVNRLKEQIVKYDQIIKKMDGQLEVAGKDMRVLYLKLAVRNRKLKKLTTKLTESTKEWEQKAQQLTQELEGKSQAILEKVKIVGEKIVAGNSIDEDFEEIGKMVGSNHTSVTWLKNAFLQSQEKIVELIKKGDTLRSERDQLKEQIRLSTVAFTKASTSFQHAEHGLKEDLAELDVKISRLKQVKELENELKKMKEERDALQARVKEFEKE